MVTQEDALTLATAIVQICAIDGLKLDVKAVADALLTCHAHADRHDHTDCEVVALMHREADAQGVVLRGHRP
jgi:hypothetical protein